MSSPRVSAEARYLARATEAEFLRGLTPGEIIGKAAEQLAARPRVERSAVRYHRRRNIEKRTAEYIAGPLYRDTRRREYLELAERLHGCRQRGPWGLAADGALVVAWEKKCGLIRLCPDESRQEGRRVKESYAPGIRRLRQAGARLHWAVFSLPNYAPGELAHGKAESFKLFRDRVLRAQRDKRKRFALVGALVVQEDPLSKHGDWNIHLNALLLVDGPLDYGDLRRAWNGDPAPGEPLPWQLEIRPIPPNLAESAEDKLWRETIKYAVQAVASKSIEKWEGGSTEAPAFTDWPTERAHEWLQAGKKFRRTRAYGGLKSIGADVLKVRGALKLSGVVWMGHFRNLPDRMTVSYATCSIDLIREGLRDNSSAAAGRQFATGPPIPAANPANREAAWWKN